MQAGRIRRDLNPPLPERDRHGRLIRDFDKLIAGSSWAARSELTDDDALRRKIADRIACAAFGESGASGFGGEINSIRITAADAAGVVVSRASAAPDMHVTGDERCDLSAEIRGEHLFAVFSEDGECLGIRHGFRTTGDGHRSAIAVREPRDLAGDAGFVATAGIFDGKTNARLDDDGRRPGWRPAAARQRCCEQ